MEDNIFDKTGEFDKIQEVDLKERMEKFYINYAMSVIAARALPDVRDGLKPVQRRVLYSMIELNNGPDKPHRKSARIVANHHFLFCQFAPKGAHHASNPALLFAALLIQYI